jgi:hypothetical protein
MIAATPQAMRTSAACAARESASPGSIPEAASEPSPRDLIAFNVAQIVLRVRCIQLTFREGSVSLAAPEFARDDVDAPAAAIVEGNAGKRRQIRLP